MSEQEINVELSKEIAFLRRELDKKERDADIWYINYKEKEAENTRLKNQMQAYEEKYQLTNE